MKSRREKRRGMFILPLLLTFVAGGAIGWWLRAGAPPPRIAAILQGDVLQGDSRREELAPVVAAEPPPVVASDPPEPTIGAVRPRTDDLIADLRQRHLRLPLDQVDVKAFKGQFDQRRGGGTRGHEAVDLLAPRNTPIYAVDEGTIAKLFVSKAGGNTVYKFDADGRVCYYYAHLERYAEGLHQDQTVRRGDLIGHVGTTGNAPPDVPHLHFALFKLTTAKRWWEGTAIDPFLVYGPLP